MDKDDDLKIWSDIMEELGPHGFKEVVINTASILMENMKLTNLLGNKINQTVNNVEYCCCENKEEKRINMEELKNCPFCDGKAIIRRRNQDHIMRDKYFACCTSCKNKTGYYDSEEEAITAWNKRVDNAMNDIHYCPHCGKRLM